MRNAMIIDSKDNVAVAIEPIAKGEMATYVCEGKEVYPRYPQGGACGEIR